ncbi:MAG: hypothetical protein ACOYNL_10720 [Rickettsiales bacterium]
MLPPTKDILEEISRANFHQDFGVSIPERISLIQLYRWLIFGFTPLPKNIELQLSHLPIFDSRIRGLITKISVSEKLIVKIKQLLQETLKNGADRITESRIKSLNVQLDDLAYEAFGITEDERQQIDEAVAG